MPRRRAVDGSAPTMRDVASLAEVSPMTVSRVLQNHPNVSAENRERVLAAVKQLGYRRNDVARVLSQGRRLGAVGLIVTNLANPFYARLALGIESIVTRDGIRVMVTNSNEDPERERAAVGDFVSRQVDGIIIVPAGSNHEYLVDDVPARTPIAMVARPPTGVEADCVLVDDFGGAYEATRRLIQHGRTRIGFVGNPPSVYTGSERFRGYCAALEAAGVPLRDSYVKRARDIASAEQATAELLALPEPPDAVFCTNNRNTLGAYRAVHRVSAGIVLAGFDDFELSDMLSVPTLIVDYDADELGRRAAQLLLERLTPGDRRYTGPMRRAVVPTTVVEHGFG
ncbi:LacI family DNA-binding transcriptional regulator [Kribbella sp. CA-253562]|uniref:LacI family DNA-binding transcriptional regulator n=1 Tax=Kribbella sp. CA-253562 TaxID=3239942 RepID=UPI003D902B0A